MDTIGQHPHAVDPDVSDTTRKMMRIVKGRAIANGVGVEDHHICTVRGAQATALTQR